MRKKFAIEPKEIFDRSFVSRVPAAWIVCFLLLCCLCFGSAYGQTPSGKPHLLVENLDGFPSNHGFVASRLQTPWSRDKIVYNSNRDTVRLRLYNKGGSPLLVSSLTISDNLNWEIVGLNDAAYNPATDLPLSVAPGSHADLQVAFVTAATTDRVKLVLDNLTIASNDDVQPQKVLELHGLLQKEGEGNNEPRANEIISTYGFTTKTGFSHTDPDDGANGKAKGDEVLTSYFIRVDSLRPVTVRQMAAYHGCCDVQPESLRWFPKGATGTLKTAVSHIAEDAQTLLPRRSRSLPYSPSKGSFNPTTPFGFRIGSQDWTDTSLNKGRKIGIRVWKALDGNGFPIPNTYIISNDYLGSESTNYDYNDNMHYVTNVRPESGPASTSELASTPSAVDFGEHVLQTSEAFTLNLKSLGQVYAAGLHDPNIVVSSVSVVGDNAGEFAASMPAKTTLAAGEATTLSLSFNPQSEGLKIADLLIYYNNANGPLRVPLYGIAKANGTTVTVPYRIKSGSSSDMVVRGKTWAADTPYALDNLEPFTNAELTEISATDDDVLYFREQSSNGDQKPFRYEMPLEDGDYWVRLHFAEVYWGTPGSGLDGGEGSRVMSVSVEGESKLINLDVAGTVGAASAVVKNIPVKVSDGKLNIDFSATADRPTVSAIEVYHFKTGTVTSVPGGGQSGELKLYPNPVVQQTFTLQFSSAYQGKVSLQLVDMLGRVYDLAPQTVRPGGDTKTITVFKPLLPPGVYSLKIFGENGKTGVVKLVLH